MFYFSFADNENVKRPWLSSFHLRFRFFSLQSSRGFAGIWNQYWLRSLGFGLHPLLHVHWYIHSCTRAQQTGIRLALTHTSLSLILFSRSSSLCFWWNRWTERNDSPSGRSSSETERCTMFSHVTFFERLDVFIDWDVHSIKISKPLFACLWL